MTPTDYIWMKTDLKNLLLGIYAWINGEWQRIDGDSDTTIYTKTEVDKLLLLFEKEISKKLKDGGYDIAITADSKLSSISKNPVQNKVIKAALDRKQNTIFDLDSIRAGANRGKTSLQPEDIDDFLTITDFEGESYIIVNPGNYYTKAEIDELISHIPSGGGQPYVPVTPDWNENNSLSAAYIKNRTHSKSSYNGTLNDYTISGSFLGDPLPDLVPGSTARYLYETLKESYFSFVVNTVEDGEFEIELQRGVKESESGTPINKTYTYSFTNIDEYVLNVVAHYKVTLNYGINHETLHQWDVTFMMSDPYDSEWSTTITNIDFGVTTYNKLDVGYLPLDEISFKQVQADWNESDSSSNAYIKNKPSISSVPTISTNVFTDRNSDDKTSSPKSVYNAINPAVQSTIPSGGMLPNVLYNLGTLTGNITFTVATPADNTIINHYYWIFETGNTAPTVTWPTAIVSWIGGDVPTITSNKRYEVSLLNGVAVYEEA